MNALEKAAMQWSDAALGMWARRWYGIAAAWIAALVGVAVMLSIPQRYEASARIYVDTQSILKPLMKGLAVQPNAEQQVVMLSRMLVSRDNVERLVEMAGLASPDDGPREREALLDGVGGAVRVRGAGGDNLYTLSFRHSDPQVAERVVASLVTIFRDSNRSVSRRDSEAARAFLDGQIDAYREKLEAAEAKLKAFRLRHIDMVTADGADPSSRVAELAAQVAKVRLELREAENVREATQAALQRQMTQLALASPAIEARIEVQRRQLDLLLQRYADAHPDVQGARRTLEELELQRRSEARRSGAAAASSNPALQELNRMLAAAEAQVATLRARASEYASRYERAVAQTKAFPQLEADWAQLNRDYAVQKKSYEDLRARRESAAMSANVEAASGIAEFRLIDPPRSGLQPVAPNRKLLMALVLFGSLGAGMGVAFLVSQLQPFCHRAAQLREHFDLPLLGVVSLAQTTQNTRHERIARWRFAMASGSLVAALAVGMAAMALTGAGTV